MDELKNVILRERHHFAIILNVQCPLVFFLLSSFRVTKDVKETKENEETLESAVTR